ncbi:MAG: ABC transporter ATP-binding protein [Pseudomonadota bacterium]
MTLLQINALTKRYGGLIATKSLSLEVQAGEIHAIIGPNGAGKTTLIHQIAGSLQPDTGQIIFDGVDITKLAMHQRVKLGLARSYQITNVFQAFTVLDNLALAVQARSGNSMRFWRQGKNELALFDAATSVAQQLGLSNKLHSLASNLSHGEQRQLELGLALATQPKLLLLDEPMAGMGKDESANLSELIQNLRGKITVILIEHDMDAVFRLADRISVLVAGSIIASGTPDFIRQHPEVRKAYLGDEVSNDAKHSTAATA